MKFIVQRSVLAGMALGATLALAIGYGTAVAQDNSRRPAVIATVNLSAVVEKLEKGAQGIANLRAELSAAQAEEKRRRDEIEAKQLQLQDMVKQHGVEAPTAQMIALQEEVAQATLNLRAWSRFKIDQIDIDKSLLYVDLYRSIKQAASQMATTSGYDLVLVDDSRGEINTSGDARVSREAQVLQQIAGRRMLYANPTLDITDELITRMNNEFKAAGVSP